MFVLDLVGVTRDPAHALVTNVWLLLVRRCFRVDLALFCLQLSPQGDGQVPLSFHYLCSGVGLCWYGDVPELS